MEDPPASLIEQGMNGDKISEHIMECELPPKSKCSLTTEIPLPEPLAKCTLPTESGEITIPKESGELTIPKESGEMTIPKESGEMTIPKESGEMTIPKESVGSEKGDTPKDEEKKSDSNSQETKEPVKSTPKANGGLNLKYEVGQWSPSNPTGQKKYSLEFMMALSKCEFAKKRPEKTGQLSLVEADEARLQNRQAIRPRSMDVDTSNLMSSFSGKSTFVPAFVKASPRGNGGAPNRRSQHGKQSSRSEGRRDGRGGDGRDGRDSRDGRSNKPNVIEIDLSLGKAIKLHEAENAWKPARAKREPKTASEKAEIEDLYKKFRSILNKITPQNFSKLVTQIRDLRIDNEEKLTGIIDIVFEKALDEPNFSEIYALMCNELKMINVKVNPSNNNGVDIVTFRQKIVKRCQEEFQKPPVDERISAKRNEEIQECTDPEKKKQLILLLNETERKERVRSVGNVRFIGELFKQKYITGNIMVDCIKTLLKKIEEETMECLCKLLTTIGKDLEMGAQIDLQQYIFTLRKIGDDKNNKLNSRIRFMIKDVIELRSNAWIPRQKLAVPKKLDDYQMDSEADRYNKNSHSKHSNSMSTSHRDNDSYFSRNAGTRSVNDDSGWSPVTPRNRPNKPYTIDPAKLKSMNASTDISLTPPSGNWGRGSASGKKDVTPAGKSASAMTNPRKTSTITFNPYAALLDEDSHHNPPKDYGLSLSLNRNNSRAKSPADLPKSDDNKTVNLARMMDNFVKCGDDPYPELLDYIQCSESAEQACGAVKYIIKKALQTMKNKQIQIVGKVVGTAVCKQFITCEQFLEIFKSSLDDMRDLYLTDEFWEKLSSFLWAQNAQNELMFSQLHKACSPVISSNKGYEMLMALFLEKVEDSNESNLVKRLWGEPGKMALTDWMSLENAQEFVKCMSLDFLSCPREQLIPESACAQFVEQMRKRISLEDFKKWVESTIGDGVKEGWFIRALTEAVYTYTMCSPEFSTPRFDLDRLKVYYPLLIHYIAYEPSLELECLYAIQSLLTELEHPQGIAVQLFEHLWDNGEAVTNDSFLKWEADNTQPKGKGVLLKELTSFFTILKSNDDSSDDSDEQ